MCIKSCRLFTIAPFAHWMELLFSPLEENLEVSSVLQVFCIRLISILKAGKRNESRASFQPGVCFILLAQSYCMTTSFDC